MAVHRVRIFFIVGAVVAVHVLILGTSQVNHMAAESVLLPVVFQVSQKSQVQPDRSEKLPPQTQHVPAKRVKSMVRKATALRQTKESAPSLSQTSQLVVESAPQAELSVPVTGPSAPAKIGDNQKNPPLVPGPKPYSPAIELPSSKASYLNNPPPVYPAISQRLGEQGQVMIRVLISKEGKATQGEIAQSSGYLRLDQAALETVLLWRYLPGIRDGIAQDMWFTVPINYRLN